VTTVVAPAKLTWFLEVTGREDNGWHTLRAEMVTLSLGDTVHFADGDNLTITPDFSLSTGPDNLIRRALALVGRTASVHVDKAIPPGAGLGGGSADAGAVLRWAGGVSDEEAFTLGSDVPFCQRGGRALVEGVGERVTPLPFEERAVTLFLPDFGVNTAACFRAYDDLIDRGVPITGRNHLEAAAVRVEPRLTPTLLWLRERYGDVVMAGSGSTCFVEGHVTADDELAGPTGTLRVVRAVTVP
jgi:4-diphosphocytidyl-2-C-methyl-D-erythritol kinase